MVSKVKCLICKPGVLTVRIVRFDVTGIITPSPSFVCNRCCRKFMNDDQMNELKERCKYICTLNPTKKMQAKKKALQSLAFKRKRTNYMFWKPLESKVDIWPNEI